ncbi:LacI family DNA-binding transcriptional regulator [Aurantivibrio infirmus]
MEAPITLQDVAEKAGVSVATASRALTGIKVKSKNQEKVLKAAKELGYSPNEAARSLRSVSTKTIGVVFHKLSGGLGIELIASLSAGFDARGYSLFVSTAQGQDELYDKLVNRFLERRVDALCCVHGAGKGEALKRFLASGTPVTALISQSAGYCCLPLIEPSIEQATKDCLKHLKALGHKHLIVYFPDRQGPTFEEFAKIAGKSGFKVESRKIGSGFFNAEEELKTLCSEQNKATALIGPQSNIASLFVAADKISLEVPASISLIAIRDRELQTQNIRLPLSIIHLEPARLGTEAADLIANQLAGEPGIDKKLRVEIGKWIEGQTTAKAAN